MRRRTVACKRAHAHGRLQTRDQPLDRQRGVGRQRDRNGGFLVAMRARDDRHDRALAVAICRQSMRAAASLRGAPGSAITTAAGLTADEGGRRIGPFGLDDREGAGGAQRFDQIGRRTVGDHDHRTLQRHEGARTLQNDCATPNGARY